MSHINMAGLNGGGGSLGGMPLMNNGTNGATPRVGNDNEEPNYEARLHTFIYDYFLKNEQWACARALFNSGLNMDPPPRQSDGDVNGAADGSMHMDSKDGLDSKRPSDLPLAGNPADQQGNSFLLEWFALFWDVYFAQKKSSRATEHANLYVRHSQAQSKMRQEQQQALLRGVPGMMNPAGMNYEQVMRMQGGMPLNRKDLHRQAQLNHQNAFMGQPNQAQVAAAHLQMAKNQQQQMIQQQQMRRDPSDVDINGQRPHTPSSAENAPSPSKRPRLDNIPSQMIGNGRGPSQAFPGQMMDTNQAVHASNMLMQGGINPSSLSEPQFVAFQQQNPAVQQKSIQVYAQNLAKNQQRQSMSKPGMQGHGSPIMQSGLEAGGSGVPDFFNNPALQMGRGVPNGNQAGGNHALQDYQMQLMLLEQQNKKRLLMARQEQDVGRPDGQPGMPGAPGFAPGMSPSGSRSGPSPGPNDQMRGTPKMAKSGLPGSPMPDGSMPQTRVSPAAVNFANGPVPPEMFQQVKAMNEANGTLMRPPQNSHPHFNGQPFNPQHMEAMARVQQPVRIPNGTWPQGPPGQAPMMQQPPQVQQPAQMGTPQPRNDMPPPQAVPTGPAVNGRPNSPNQPAAPPTPNQTNKANPNAKGKKERETRKRPKKTSTTGPAAATPSSEAENPPPTPTPNTPNTPKHPASFNNNPKNDVPSSQAANTMQGGLTSTAPAQVAPPQQDANSMSHLEFLDGTRNDTFSMDYGPLDNGDVLENFDFDSFLQSTDDGGFNFDPSTLAFGSGDGVEAGAGDV